MQMCPVCRDYVAKHLYANVYRCSQCQHLYTVAKVPGENPDPTEPPPDPPPAPLEPPTYEACPPVRTCMVCLGKGSFPTRRANIGETCRTCKGAGTIDDPDHELLSLGIQQIRSQHDALVKRVEALEVLANRLKEWCDAQIVEFGPTK